MGKSAKQFLTNCLCILAINLSCLPTAADAQLLCQRAVELQNLVAYLGKLNWQEGRLNKGQLRNLDSQISDLKSSQILPVLKRNGRIDEKRTVLKTLAMAEDISRLRRVPDRRKLQDELRRAKSVIAEACQARLGLPETLGTQSYHGRRPSESPQLVWFNQAGTLLQITIFMLALLSVIGVIVLSRTFYNYAYAVIYSRKACRIKAVIDFGTEELGGYIVVLGKNGCRFEPSNKSDLNRIGDLIGPECPNLLVLDLTIQLDLNGVANSYISTFFVKPIPHAQLSQVLEKSVTRPYYVQRVVMKSNLGRQKKA